MRKRWCNEVLSIGKQAKSRGGARKRQNACVSATPALPRPSPSCLPAPALLPFPRQSGRQAGKAKEAGGVCRQMRRLR